MSKNLTFTKCFEYYKPNQEIATAIFSSTEDQMKHVIIAEPLAEVWYEPRAISYLAGPIADRLHAFEELGFEPDQLQEIITEYKKMKAQEEKLAEEPVKEPKRLDMLAAMAYSHNVLQNMYPKSLFISTDGWSNDSLWDMKLKQARGSILKIGDSEDMKKIENLKWPISKEFAKYVRNDVETTAKMVLNSIYGKRTALPSIKDVIFSDPATIIFWKDGTKTVVKAQDGEKYDPEKGLAMAISKKALGNTREYYHTFLRWLKKGKKGPERKILDIRVPASDIVEAFRKFSESVNANFDVSVDTMSNGEEVVKIEEKKNGRKD